MDVGAAADQTVEALRAVLRSQGIVEYVVVDHGRDMAAAGAPSHPAWTIVFGNPAAGEALLARDLAAAVDIPLRLAVIETDGASAIILRPMGTLLGPGLDDIADRFTSLLRRLASAAKDAAERRG